MLGKFKHKRIKRQERTAFHQMLPIKHQISQTLLLYRPIIDEVLLLREGIKVLVGRVSSTEASISNRNPIFKERSWRQLLKKFGGDRSPAVNTPFPV